MEKIELDYPFEINGVPVTVIEYDFNHFTASDYFEAIKSRKASSAQSSVHPLNDYDMHYAIGVRAILASNKDKGWSAEDFNRIKGSDVSKIMFAGLNFFGAKPDEPQENNSDGQLESIRNASTPPGKS